MAEAVLPSEEPRHRRPGRVFVALLSGVMLFTAAQFVAGHLAAIAIPGDFFAFFGKERTGLALFIVNLAVLAIPLSLVALVWCWLLILWSGDHPARTAALCLAGFLTGLAVLDTLFVLDFVALDADGKVPLRVFLQSLLWPSWWALPGLLAIPAGIGAAAWLRTRGGGSGQTTTAYFQCEA